MKIMKHFAILSILILAAGMIWTPAWAERIAGTVAGINAADQSFTLQASKPKQGNPGWAVVQVAADTDFVGLQGIEALKKGDKVQVDVSESASAGKKADRIMKA